MAHDGNDANMVGNGVNKILLSTIIIFILISLPLISTTFSGAPLGDGNAPPVANAGDDITGVLLNDTVMLNGSASVDEDIDNCTWIWESPTHPDIHPLPANFSRPSFTVNVEETITFRLTLVDPSGLSSTDEVDVIVDVNEAPRISIASPAPSGSEGPFYPISRPIEFSANGTTDPEGRTLSFSWSSNVSGPLSEMRYFSKKLDTLGWHRITLTVSDPNGGTSEEFIDIKVREDPAAPRANILIRPSGTDHRYSKSELITLDASSTVDENSFDTLDTMNFTWSTNLSGGAVLGYGAVLVVYLSEGFHNITLRVTDTDGLSDTKWSHIEVYNQPPTAWIEAPGVKMRASVPTVNVSEPAALSAFYSSDPDRDTLEYIWDFGDGRTGYGINITHSWTGFGTYNITLTVDDGSHLNSRNSAMIVISVNSVPAAVADQGISVEAGGSFRISANGSRDDDEDPLTYRWDFDGDGTYDSSGFEPAWKFTEAGDFTVTLLVSDGFAWSEATSVIHVYLHNEAPKAAISNKLVDGKILVPLIDDRGEVDLDATPSYDPDDDVNGDGEINGREVNNLTYYWDLDASKDSDNDGIPDNDRDRTGKKVTVKVTSNRPLTVILNVSDTGGKTDSLDIVINGDHPPRSLSIRVSPASKVLVGAQVRFTGTATDDDSSDRNRLEYHWEFGDGASSTASGYQTNHVYGSEGSYDVTLTVSDGMLTSSFMTTITAVEMAAPLISYPTDNSVVSGMITVSGNIREVRNFEVDKVEVKVGDGGWKKAEGTTQWNFKLDTSRYNNGKLTITVHYTVEGAQPIQTESSITVNVANNVGGGFNWTTPAIGFVIFLLIFAVLYFTVLRTKHRNWDDLLPPPGPGPGMPPILSQPALPPAGSAIAAPAPGSPPPQKVEPRQSEPPAEESREPKTIKIKCPACNKVFRAADDGTRPLHVTCKHCGAAGTIEHVPGDEEKETPESPVNESVQEDSEEEGPEPVPIICPSCGNLFELDEVASSARCPTCGVEGKLDDETISLLEERFGRKEADEVTLKCPSCRGTFKVRSDADQIICPYCGAKGKLSG